MLAYKKPALWLILVAVLACIIVVLCFFTSPVSDTHKIISTVTSLTPAKSGVQSSKLVSFADDDSIIPLPSRDENYSVSGNAHMSIDNEFCEAFSHTSLTDCTLYWSDTEHDIAVYGVEGSDNNYYTGLIFDLESRGTFYYTIPYTLSHLVTTHAFYFDEGANTIYMPVLSGHGAGVSAWDLYIFNIDDMENPLYIDTWEMVEYLNQHLSVYYNSESAMATALWDGEVILESPLTRDMAPTDIYNGDHIEYDFSVSSSGITVIFTPTFTSYDPNEFGYLSDIRWFSASLHLNGDSTFDLAAVELVY